ncbi:hypothetical protein Kfla_6821 [Kribbella flavida DSM 17836]|uniref:Uncharacterized protein n=1 Tax=Kribbella flavida (strain DSM 17836 / JCM 10339 / NBRC 14399) TaxID=479435 RepID=D2Q2B6_KRIFD|nr:hypothetical protein [Kribbella flavida]ADB35812.1 hypothetical protein Kfla_6821 [Kribbella flavida DSM 17836]
MTPGGANRALRPLIATTAALVLLAGCGKSGDDKPQAEQSPGTPEASASSTPSGPGLASFEQPKAFAPVSAIAESSTGTSNLFAIEAGMVGPASLYALRSGLTGRTLTANSWQVPSSDVPTTTTSDFTAPMAVQLDGKEAIATAYVQRVQGSGTQKPHGQVAFQWIDPAEGDILATAAFDLTPLVGPGNGGGRLISQAYDAATGQVAVSLGVATQDGNAKLRDLTVFADPATKKATGIPSLRVGGVLNGEVVGARGDQHESAKNSAIVQVDAVAGTVRKTTAVPAMNYLTPVGTGGKHGYFAGSGYQQDSTSGRYLSSVFAADIATGTVVDNKFPIAESRPEPTSCFSDHVSSVVCHRATAMREAQVVAGFDDTTGKKTWGYDSTSANRVVPLVTAVYNGLVYGSADDTAVVLDAKTGQDVSVPTPTTGASPTDGSPTDGGSTPPDSGTPSDGSSPAGTPTSGSGNLGGWGDLSLLHGKPKSPEMVSKYGSVYLQDAGSKAPLGTEKILVVQKAIG